MMTMKTAMVATAAALMAVVGCKTVPSADTVKALASASGLAAGYVVEMTKVDDSTKESVVKVVEVLEAVVPSADQTFTETWGPLIEKELEVLIASGKIDESEAKLAGIALNVATSGLDHYFEKHPKWKQHADLVSAAVDGFCGSFISVVKPNDKLAASPRTYEVDSEMYLYLKSKYVK